MDFLPLWKTVLRFLVNSLICGPLALLTLIPQSVHLVVIVLFYNLLMGFAFSFLIYGVNRVLLFKLGLISRS